MSIPPLVCSTPPPPDQCEDDNNPEDFDLSYNLSQEDDDDDENNRYNYGNFSSYNHFQSSPDNKILEIKEQEITNSIGNEVPKEIFLKYENQMESDHNNESPDKLKTNDVNENKLKCEEDINIEDLNLKVNEEIESNIESSIEQAESSKADVVSVKDFDIPSNLCNNSPTVIYNTNALSFDEHEIDSVEVSKDVKTKDLVGPEVVNPIEAIANAKSKACEGEITFLQDDNLNELNEPIKFEPVISSDDLQSFSQSSDNTKKPSENNVIYDDFEDFDDFDDFQSNTKKYTSIVENSNNPWENAEMNESDFGNFTANFDDENEINFADTVTLAKPLDQFDGEHQGKENDFDNEDDFGDFDDFKSTSVKAISNELTMEDSTQFQDMPVLNLQSTENEYQIMESITKVLSAVFLEEISEPEGEFEGKLESLLSETWGHLMETDERQPYIVNWNNSLGQKTLLKALCIDSRNILFGPKWSSNMPKYAANLSNAPLQPQKQVSVPSSIVTQNELIAEKSSSKPTTWTDPFTSDGQESCNTESLSATITPAPTDLDVFEAEISTKPDKIIYSNTMGVQPLRQINLPDTHIFTPTDSEIPRSKTIHYDRGPTVLLPRTNVAEIKTPTDISNNTITDNVGNNEDNNGEWEFQNFKSSTDLPSVNKSQQQITSRDKGLEQASALNLPKPNIAYQTELLQPIKVEPAMPSLNWPDPGEVKGAFENFSEFVSISSQPSDKDNNSMPPAETYLETLTVNRTNKLSSHSEPADTLTEISKCDNDDDFDTFKSALPENNTSESLKSSNIGGTSNEISSSQLTMFDYDSPKLSSNKSDTISFANIPRPNDALTQNIGIIPKITELTSKSLLPSGTQIPNNLLQPSPVSFSGVQSQQKSAQILQPLSLESYSQINWPSPGIDLQDLSRFNPVETLQSLKSDLSVSGLNKVTSPSHVPKTTSVNQALDNDVWGEFVSSQPKQQQSQPKKPSVFVDDDEWTDFISSPSVKPQNGLNTISLNVHTNSNIQKTAQSKFGKKTNQPPMEIPALNYITPKSNSHKSYNDKHFQNL